MHGNTKLKNDALSSPNYTNFRTESQKCNLHTKKKVSIHLYVILCTNDPLKSETSKKTGPKPTVSLPTLLYPALYVLQIAIKWHLNFLTVLTHAVFINIKTNSIFLSANKGHSVLKAQTKH